MVETCDQLIWLPDADVEEWRWMHWGTTQTWKWIQWNICWEKRMMLNIVVKSIVCHNYLYLCTFLLLVFFFFLPELLPSVFFFNRLCSEAECILRCHNKMAAAIKSISITPTGLYFVYFITTSPLDKPLWTWRQYIFKQHWTVEILIYLLVWNAYPYLLKRNLWRLEFLW